MKKFALTALTVALFSGSAFAKVDINPGNNSGLPDFNQPGGDNGMDDGYTHPGAGIPRPQPGTGAENPVLPEIGLPDFGNGESAMGNGQAIALMGEAFEKRVDVVNGYLSQAGEAISNNSDRITNLESAFEQQAAHTAKEISRLDDRIDGIGAMSQAVTAARPQLFGNQTSAIGMGIGHMGDATALAAGYVHRINENWSANANISTTFGTDDRDTSVGAGVAYAW